MPFSLSNIIEQANSETILDMYENRIEGLCFKNATTKNNMFVLETGAKGLVKKILNTALRDYTT